MTDASTGAPRLRPVEAIPLRDNGELHVVLHDPAGLALGQITLSPAAYLLVTLFDGQRGPDEIGRAFRARTGHDLPAGVVENAIRQLDEARFLFSPAFEAHYDTLVAEYRRATVRRSTDPRGAGLGEDEPLSRMFERMFTAATSDAPPPGTLRGMIAPHLDYRRGWDCYARAYGLLRGRRDIRRVVILGTNHFGLAAAVVATDKDFATPLGTTPTDRAFLGELSRRCGTDLCEYEFDHAREHSVELQVHALQHLLGPDSFSIVPIICPDVCGPTGTRPITGEGTDLREFARHLRDLLRETDVSTIVVAGADLSHIGRRFGDNCDLDDEFLDGVARCDRRALDLIRAARPEEFRELLAANGNSTRVCSAGCIYALLTALPDAHPTVLHYHQAVDRDAETCVTCAAVALTDDESSPTA